VSRTYRHIRKAKYKRFEFESQYGHWTRDERRTNNQLFPVRQWWWHFRPDQRREAARRDRHLMKDSLRHGSTKRYWLRKNYDDPGW